MLCKEKQKKKHQTNTKKKKNTPKKNKQPKPPQKHRLAAVLYVDKQKQIRNKVATDYLHLYRPSCSQELTYIIHFQNENQ